MDVGYDTDAKIRSLAAGLTTWQELYAEKGDNWESELEQKAKEAAFIQALAIRYAVTPAEIAAAALPAAAPAQPASMEEEPTV